MNTYVVDETANTVTQNGTPIPNVVKIVVVNALYSTPSGIQKNAELIVTVQDTVSEQSIINTAPQVLNGAFTGNPRENAALFIPVRQIRSTRGDSVEIVNPATIVVGNNSVADQILNPDV